MGQAHADVWDTEGGTDNTAAATRNRLVHGTRQSHDVGDIPAGSDLDWYVLWSAPRASYEVITEGYTDEIPIATRYTANGSTSLTGQSDVDGLGDLAYSVRWRNTTATAEESRLRVTPATTANSTSDNYDIRMYETTIYIGRFNNSASQVTVLICQNPSNVAINLSQYFWGSGGALLATSSFTLQPKNTQTTAGVAGTAGQGGSVTVAHDGPYGSLNCKGVALEPDTGFSFDTPGVYRPL